MNAPLTKVAAIGGRSVSRTRRADFRQGEPDLRNGAPGFRRGIPDLRHTTADLRDGVPDLRQGLADLSRTIPEARKKENMSKKCIIRNKIYKSVDFFGVVEDR